MRSYIGIQDLSNLDSVKQTVKVTPTGNNLQGIDGVLRDNLLGLDKINHQEKQHKAEIIGATILREIVGARIGFNARKGVLIATTALSKDAEENVSKIDKCIILISGSELSVLMTVYNVRVSVRDRFRIKEIDLDYIGDL